tara:strand:+ start:385 stop:888 length:504 start_codon:yes stop_codon:yes gene_type:complete
MTLTLNGSANTITPVSAVQPAGSILQVISGDTTTAVEINGTTWTDTGVTATITPASGTKILVMVRQSFSTHRNTTSAYGSLRLLRDSTVIQNTHGTTYHYGIRADGNDHRWWRGAIPFTYLDTHGADGSTAVVYHMEMVGQSTSDTPEYKAQDDNSPSSIVLMEVAV